MDGWTSEYQVHITECVHVCRLSSVRISVVLVLVVNSVYLKPLGHHHRIKVTERQLVSHHIRPPVSLSLVSPRP